MKPTIKLTIDRKFRQLVRLSDEAIIQKQNRTEALMSTLSFCNTGEEAQV